MRKFMKPHTTCPYFDKGKNICTRTGCLFLTPCIKVNESRNEVKNYEKVL